MSQGVWKSVLITGSSRGIGLQLVKELANSSNRPATIIATARDPAASAALQELSKTHSGLHIVTLDVSSEQSISSASEHVQSIVGNSGLNCLINNAAIGFSTNISTVTPEAMMSMFQVNSVAPLFVTKAFMPLLETAAARSGGMGIHRAAVINMSSVLGSITLNYGDAAKFRSYAYRTSKAALNMVTRCLAADLESSGILCMSLHPGWVRTDMGGPHADLTVEQSVSGILSVLFSLSERDHGEFLDYHGQKLQW
ncbi:C-factor [Poeciliopsis prolifica]|uniref:C-factor n=1 Tax=Poeciliopsis prolifica TaxID=188132 RepID=UPI00241360FA|nr:C-factor [Poeciliopsis prolifica]